MDSLSLLQRSSRLQCRRCGFNLWVSKIPWRRSCQPTPLFLPGDSPWTEEPNRISIAHDWATKHSTAQHMSQLRLKIPHAPTKPQHRQINKAKYYQKKKKKKSICLKACSASFSQSVPHPWSLPWTPFKMWLKSATTVAVTYSLRGW